MKKYIVVFQIFTLLLLAGCWDRTEIEDVGFILGIGLDPVKESDEEVERKEKEMGFELPHDQMFKATYQIAIPGNIQTQQSAGKGKPSFNITSTGITNFKILRTFSARRSRQTNPEHLKAIIINQELARKGIMEHLIDFYIRDHAMRRRTKVFISEEEAKTLLEDTLPLENILAVGISELIEQNEPRVLPMIEPTNIGTVSENVIGHKSFVIPRIVDNGKGDVKIAGAAVFMGKTNKMIGWLGEEESAAYKWLIGKAGNGIVEVPYEEKSIFVFEVSAQATKINFERKDDQNKFDVEIRAEGAFTENWIPNIEITDQKTIVKLEEAVAKRINDQTTKLIKKMQNEFYTDFISFGQKVKMKDYSYWKTVKDRWDGEDGEFSKAKIQVNTKIQIRHYMINEKLEEK
jgi:spore germination protein